ncbi:hypothetical protein Tco_1008381 [Tanacetum coccineum]
MAFALKSSLTNISSLLPIHAVLLLNSSSIRDFFWVLLLRLRLNGLISFFSLPLLLLRLSHTKGAIEDSDSSIFSLSSAAIDGNGGTNLVIVVDDGRVQSSRLTKSLAGGRGPNSITLTLLAKLREQSDSLKSFSLGLICTNISVFESPPN